jgi:hypothetical protein
VAVSFIGGGNQSTQENHWSVTSHWQNLSHNVASITPCHELVELTILVVIGTDCTGSCKSNHHMVTITTAPIWGLMTGIIYIHNEATCCYMYNCRWEKLTCFILIAMVIKLLYFHYITNVVSSNPAQARSTQYSIMWIRLSMTCDRSVVFFSFLHQ